MVSVSRIQVLPPELADQIAAGEVVERPASVVKELVENALDAGARRIDIDVEGGGRRLIRVVDDGGGMTPEEARLALKRHATSKLRRLEDLFELTTMGFRGEALPSIAAVSRFALTTRTAEQVAAFRLEVEGGVERGATEVGAPVGTQVEVRDLLWNVPARLKFLKGEATEAGHVTETVTRLALVHPEVHFRLRQGGRVALDLPAHRSLLERVRAVLPRRLAGRMHPGEYEEAGVRVTMFLAPPEEATTTSRGLYLYVGRRFVRDRGLLHAVGMGYGELVPQGRYAQAIVMIDVPAGTVDVNVHPQKTEVRFSRPQEVYAAVRHGVADAVARAPWLAEAAGDRPSPVAMWTVAAKAPPLVASDVAAGYAAHQERLLLGWRPRGAGVAGVAGAARLVQRELSEERGAGSLSGAVGSGSALVVGGAGTHVGEPWAMGGDVGDETDGETHVGDRATHVGTHVGMATTHTGERTTHVGAGETGEKTTHVGAGATGERTTHVGAGETGERTTHVGAGETGERATHVGAATTHAEVTTHVGHEIVALGGTTRAREGQSCWGETRGGERSSRLAGETSDATHGTSRAPAPTHGGRQGNGNVGGSRPTHVGTAERFFSELTYLGQLDRTYLLCEGAGELVLIDQHAAHERIAFQRLREAYSERSPRTQQLLFPRTLELDARQAAVAEANAEELAALGFELRPFGGSTWALTAAPADLRDDVVEGTLKELLDDLVETDMSRAASERLDAMLATIACHSVVRAGDELARGEAEALLAALDEVDFKAHCPHGRPVLLRISVAEIARRFGRT